MLKETGVSWVRVVYFSCRPALFVRDLRIIQLLRWTHTFSFYEALFVCLFVSMVVCLFVCLSLCIIGCLFVCLSLCIIGCLFVCLYVSLVVCLFVFLYQCLFLCLLFTCLLFKDILNFGASCLLLCLTIFLPYTSGFLPKISAQLVYIPFDFG